MLTASGAPPASASRYIDWSSYLLGPRHHSLNAAATAITPANAATVRRAWTWTPPPPPPGYPDDILDASPTVYRGVVYIGTNDGDEYALDERTGTPLWHFTTGLTAGQPCPARGIVSTAAVAEDPATHRAVVYFGAGDGYLYALDAANGTMLWKARVVIPSQTVNDAYIWSSPTLANGKIYIGMSSFCDQPLIRGGVKAFDRATGDLVATYYTVPHGSIGGSVWSSVSVGRTGEVYATTGNEDEGGLPPGDSTSIVGLDGNTLVRKDIWTIPPNQHTRNSDFGGSPTMFSADIGNGHATPLVGACNKNGIYYVWRAANLKRGPEWQYRVTDAATHRCLAAAIWDGSHLVVAGAATTISGMAVGGSVQQLDAATGGVVWQVPLPSAVLGSPTEDGAGVIGVGTYDMAGDTSAAYLLDASTGRILTTLSTNGNRVFGQVVFADGYALVAATTSLNAWAPRLVVEVPASPAR